MKTSVNEIAVISHSNVPKIPPARWWALLRCDCFFGFCRTNYSSFTADNFKTFNYGHIRPIGQAAIEIFANSTPLTICNILGENTVTS
jgi:hypothetical protein